MICGKSSTSEEVEKIDRLRDVFRRMVKQKELKAHRELVSDVKILKFIRGHGNDDAVVQAAFGRTLDYRVKFRVEEVRDRLLKLEKTSGKSMPPWPYTMKRFEPLHKVWDGKMPCIYLRNDANGNPITITALAAYRFADIVKEDLQDVWLDLALHCDVFFDIITQRLSDSLGGRPVGRHDVCDLAGIKMSDIGLKAMSMIKEMGKSSEMYPEMILRTTIVNMSSIGMALWGLVRPFLPAQTAAKVNVVGANFQDTLIAAGVGELPPRMGGCYAHPSTALFDMLPYRAYVSARSRVAHVLTSPVLAKGEIVNWTIVNTSGYDVGVVGELLESSSSASVKDEKKRTFLAPFRLDGGDVVRGSWKATTSGLATISLDNSHAMLRSKSLEVELYVTERSFDEASGDRGIVGDDDGDGGDNEDSTDLRAASTKTNEAGGTKKVGSA